MPTFSPQHRPRPVRLDKRELALEKVRHWTAVKRRVRSRDGGKCRICGKPGYDVHHIEFRSRGGADSEDNAVLLCRLHHEDVHGHVLRLSGNAQTTRGLRVARWQDDRQDWVWR